MNWLTDNSKGKFSGEERVKRFLSDIGYYILSGMATSVESQYKESRNSRSEIPFSAFEDPDGHFCTRNGRKIVAFERNANGKYAGRQNKSKKRQEMLHEGLVEKIEAYVVNTENEFVVDGVRYKIDTDLCQQYAAKETTDGLLYDMDRINVATSKHGEKFFYDENMNFIQRDAIATVHDITNRRKENECGTDDA